MNSIFLGKNGYRAIALCQQRLTRYEYNRTLEQYKEEQRSQSLNDHEDLNGFPTNDYCFVGIFSLIDPPRLEVPEAVHKAYRAQIRVAMITGDHPMMAKAIAKHVHILTPEISEMNGLDTFKIERSTNGQMVINMYRNKQLLNQYIPNQVTHLDTNQQSKRNSIHIVEVQTDQRIPWYKRCWLSCRNQVSEPKSSFPKTSKLEYIPYGIIVSFSYATDLNKTFFLLNRFLVQISDIWMIFYGIGSYLIKN